MRCGAVGAILAVLSGAALGWAQAAGDGPVSAEVPHWALPPQHPRAAPPSQTDAPADGLPGGATDQAAPNFPGIGFEPAAPSEDVPRLPGQEAAADPYITWASASYLFAIIKNGPAPPALATIGSASDPVPALPGQPGTRTVLGAQDIDYGTFAGGLFALGTWLGLEQHCGVEFDGLILEHRTNTNAIASDGFGNPPIARPIISAQTNVPFVEYVSFPKDFAGVLVESSSSQLWGVEANLVANLLPWQPLGDLHRFGDLRVELRGGFRYLDLKEDLDLGQLTNLLPGSTRSANFLGATVLPPATIGQTDGFRTHNQFYGGQLGATTEYCCGRFTLDLLTEAALGNAHQVVNVTGNSELLVPGFEPVPANGGLLATTTNIGRYSRDGLAVVPEVGITLNYEITPEVRAFAGYTFLYWTRVVRPGPQVETLVNLTQVPIIGPPAGVYGPLVGPRQPLLPFTDSSFWMQAISVGLEVRF
jgi:hypothetical protein